MALEIDCPECGEFLALKDEARGKTIRCRGCGEPISVPNSSRRGESSFTSPRRGGPGRKGKRKAKSKAPLWIGLGILGAAGLIGAVIAVFVFTKDDPKEQTAAPEKELISDEELAHVPISEEGQFPNSVTAPPAWMIEEAPFDVIAYFKAPSPEENAEEPSSRVRHGNSG